jgi:hypothetical protein
VLAERLDQPAGHRRCHDRVAAGDGPHAGQQLSRRGVLEEEAAGAGPEGRVDVLVEVEGGQDEDVGRGPGGDDPAGGFDAVHVRHPHVHQDHVGLERPSRRQRSDAVAGFTDDLDVGLALEHGPEPDAHQHPGPGSGGRRPHPRCPLRRTLTGWVV